MFVKKAWDCFWCNSWVLQDHPLLQDRAVPNTYESFNVKSHPQSFALSQNEYLDFDQCERNPRECSELPLICFLTGIETVAQMEKCVCVRFGAGLRVQYVTKTQVIRPNELFLMIGTKNCGISTPCSTVYISILINVVCACSSALCCLHDRIYSYVHQATELHAWSTWALCAQFQLHLCTTAGRIDNPPSSVVVSSASLLGLASIVVVFSSSERCCGVQFGTVFWGLKNPERATSNVTDSSLGPQTLEGAWNLVSFSWFRDVYNTKSFGSRIDKQKWFWVLGRLITYQSALLWRRTSNFFGFLANGWNHRFWTTVSHCTNPATKKQCHCQDVASSWFQMFLNCIISSVWAHCEGHCCRIVLRTLSYSDSVHTRILFDDGSCVELIVPEESCCGGKRLKLNFSSWKTDLEFFWLWNHNESHYLRL